MNQLKKLDKTARSFEANGKIYYVETELSIERFHEYQIYEKEAGFGLSFKSMVETIRDAYTDLNQMKAADASVKLHDLLAGITKTAEKEHVLLKICALFMNTEDEDRGTINDDMIARKIEDWKEYDVNGFFWQALNTVDGFFQIYSEMHQIILGQRKKGTEASEPK